MVMQDLVAAARCGGVVRVKVTANPHAEAFYRNLGFVRSLNLEWGPASRMELVLARDVA